MIPKAEMRPPWAAMWTSRVALFSVGLVLTTLALHRLFWMPSLVALNLFKVGFAGVALAILLALAAFVTIWRRGTPGVSRAVFGLAVSFALLAWPASLIPVYRSLPEINDVTTDTQSPPPFPVLSKIRKEVQANSATYQAAKFAEAQHKAYPDIGPLMVDRSVEETYEIVVATLQRMKMRIVNEELPNPRSGQPGLVEATDLTQIMGFHDDVVMRVTGDQRRTRVDVRSASRYGRHDLGRNALRVRTVVKELAARIEATIPLPAAEGPRVATAIPKRDIKGKIGKLVPKRLKERDPTTIAPQQLPDPDQPDAQRAPAPKGKQPARDERRARDKRQ